MPCEPGVYAYSLSPAFSLLSIEAVWRLKGERLKTESGQGFSFTLQPSLRTLRNHRSLRAFELADDLAISIYAATRSFPKEEMYGLTSQMRRAAVSVPSNIVEGCARDGEGDYLRFLDIAFGSLRELNYQIDLSRRLGFLGDQEATCIEALAEETEKVLNGLISALRKKTAER
jgi:four helix bundle protein